MTMTRFAQMTTTMMLTAALATAAAAPALACGAPPKKETVTGVFPRVELTYAPWELMTLDATAHDGKLAVGYQETFHVAADKRLERFWSERAEDLAAAGQVYVTLERTRGEKVWHLVAIGPISSRP
jgi:hypothetical protein